MQLGAGSAVGSPRTLVQTFSRKSSHSRRHAIPTMYATRDYAVVGGLVSYDASPIDLYRQVGIRIYGEFGAIDLPARRKTRVMHGFCYPF